jgi:hypothetical protein
VVSDTVRAAREELRSSVQADQRQLIPTVIGRVVAQPGERRFEFRIGQLRHFAIRIPQSAFLPWNVFFQIRI